MIRILLLLFLLNCSCSISQECPDSCDFFIPNALTPDCDQFGCEILEIVTNCSFIDFEFTLYNAFGEIIFHSTSPDDKFNCLGYKSSGYRWKLTGEFCNSKAVDATGTIYILN